MFDKTIFAYFFMFDWRQFFNEFSQSILWNIYNFFKEIQVYCNSWKKKDLKVVFFLMVDDFGITKITNEMYDDSEIPDVHRFITAKEKC